MCFICELIGTVKYPVRDGTTSFATCTKCHKYICHECRKNHPGKYDDWGLYSQDGWYHKECTPKQYTKKNRYFTCEQKKRDCICWTGKSNDPLALEWFKN